MIIQPGPVVDFLISNQNARDPFQLDWAKVGYLLNIVYHHSLIFSDLLLGSLIRLKGH